MIDALQQHYLFILIFLVLGLLTALGNYLTIKRFDQYPEAEMYPSVSVLVPARNEEANIQACVSSLLGQDYPDFEVLVLDDHSTDSTPDILARLGRADERLRVLRGEPLPDGWLGKHWACHQLYQSAGGELLLFTDADTRHTPAMLRASVSALIAERADLVTAFPREEAVSWGERLLVPFISFGIFTFLPIRLIQRFRWASVSVTIGQFMLFRRKVYEAVGGYEAVRSECVDDICLGQNIIAGGFNWRLLDGTEHVTCRMYRGFFDAVDGFSKNVFAVFDYRILPYLIGFSVVGLTFLEPPVALFSRWAGYPLTPFPPDLAAAAVVLSLALWLTAFRRFKFPAYLAFFYPVCVFLFLLVAIRSFMQALHGTATWKDRTLDRVAMRWL
ncbi:MAG: glycosyltransferase [Anaerolineales bacterium]|nr:glycosyltransferase [Anaerolineales bacterium]